uniref:Uncharacterized protein n=1 Tax=Zea mays TaxID=4577 RepID=B6UF61_MAIZE|nr:hypothetical protein [Zea mays]
MATSNTARMEDGGGDLRSTIKKWNIIYPVYLNSKKTVAASSNKHQPPPANFCGCASCGCRDAKSANGEMAVGGGVC